MDVRDEFRGHELGSDDPWINGLETGQIAALHPTAEGYQYGYRQTLVNDGIIPAP